MLQRSPKTGAQNGLCTLGVSSLLIHVYSRISPQWTLLGQYELPRVKEVSSFLGEFVHIYYVAVTINSALAK